MGEKIVVGPINKGLVNNREPFVIDNDAFPVLMNAYQWRGRVRRKRGTSLINRCKRHFDSSSTAYGSTSSFALVGGAGNLLTGFNLQSTGNIIPGSVQFTVGANVYTDSAQDGTLSGNPAGSGTINYATGAITISGGGTSSVTTATFNYYPGLPVLGISQFFSQTSEFPGNVVWDDTYAYRLLTTQPYTIYDVNFYKNPITGTYSGYTAKTTSTPTLWNGQTYQQYQAVNYQGALWSTNGLPNPFVSTNIGMQFKSITTVTVGSATTATLQITSHGLVVGDFVFVNEVSTTTGINFQTGYVTTVSDPNNVIVTFPNASLATNGTGGIAQYLTAQADNTKDCLRWYDGDPTNAGTLPGTPTGNGWVNFMPPLNLSASSISDLPAAQYYLVGAKIIFPFKDRLLFLGPIVQTSSGSPIYLGDTILYSQNGTPYYTASFTYSGTSVYPTGGDLATVTMNEILVPSNQSASAGSYVSDVTGFGGFIQLSLGQNIVSVQTNEDVLLIGLEEGQGRLVYTGNDIVPFNFYFINLEYGAKSTFSAVNFDRGVITFGGQGITMTSQTQCVRIDVFIPDEIFEINLTNNGSDRLTAARDFQNEWIYFTYPSNKLLGTFPNQTLVYNYRDETWGIFRESFTTYGMMRKASGNTWATIGDVFPTWSSWNESWQSGSTTLYQPIVIGGNQQGFVLARDEGTNESNSLFIQSFSGNTVTSPDHGLNTGDYIIISGCIGAISTQVNDNIFSITRITDDTFQLNPTISSTGSDYNGGGVIKRMYVPFIQTKQFPVAWGMGRKTRIGPQQYLITRTNNGQMTLYIYLSQNPDSPYNFGPLYPNPNVDNSSLIYSTVVYTCPESTNLGLTASNINLQMVTASQQNQIWHRVNTSLIGDTVQLAFTFDDTQMRDTDFGSQFDELEIHGFIIDVNPSMLLA